MKSSIRGCFVPETDGAQHRDQGASFEHRSAAAVARALADHGPESIAQDDTFFACTSGRLKLRVFADGHGELIGYERPDAFGPKTSDYRITSVANPGALRDTLMRALGVTGRVVKQRTLLVVGRTRIHLDHVDGLGEFLEL